MFGTVMVSSGWCGQTSGNQPNPEDVRKAGGQMWNWDLFFFLTPLKSNIFKQIESLKQPNKFYRESWVFFVAPNTFKLWKQPFYHVGFMWFYVNQVGSSAILGLRGELQRGGTPPFVKVVWHWVLAGFEEKVNK